MSKLKCYPLRLKRAAGALTAYYEDAMAPLGITLSQYAVLARLKRMGQSTTTALAEGLELERTTMVRTVRRLTELGWVEDASEPGSRDRKLQLTEAGEAKRAEVKPVWDRLQREVEERVGAEVLDLIGGIPESLGIGTRD